MQHPHEDPTWRSWRERGVSLESQYTVDCEQINHGEHPCPHRLLAQQLYDLVFQSWHGFASKEPRLLNWMSERRDFRQQPYMKGVAV